MNFNETDSADYSVKFRSQTHRSQSHPPLPRLNSLRSRERQGWRQREGSCMRDLKSQISTINHVDICGTIISPAGKNKAVGIHPAITG